MTRPLERTLTVYERPICDHYGTRRCRRTAVVSIDGVYRCEEHRRDQYGLQFAAFARPIKWLRSTQ